MKRKTIHGFENKRIFPLGDENPEDRETVMWENKLNSVFLNCLLMLVRTDFQSKLFKLVIYAQKIGVLSEK